MFTVSPAHLNLSIIITSMNPLMLRYWCTPMFTYGAIRGYRAELPSHQNLLSDNICNSVANGCVYASPFGLIKLFHTVDRFEIKARQLDPTNYPVVYVEGRGMNRNVIL